MFFFITGLNACPKKSFVFLRKELPVRLANIMKEITLLPESLLRMPSVGLVSAWYVKSFEEILVFEKTDPSESNLEKYFHLDDYQYRISVYEYFFPLTSFPTNRIM